MKIYVSLTSIKQNQTILQKTLLSIKNQDLLPDKCYLFLSEEPYLRDEGFINKELNEDLKMLLDNDMFEIRWVPNIGPYRKILPLLFEKKMEDCLIITVDDDTEYDPSFVNNLVQEYNNNHCMIGNSGWTLNVTSWKKINYRDRLENKREHICNITSGKGGIIYHPSLYWHIWDLFFRYDIIKECCETNDNIWIFFMRLVAGVKCILTHDTNYSVNDNTAINFLLNSNYNEYCQNTIYLQKTYQKLVKEKVLLPNITILSRDLPVTTEVHQPATSHVDLPMITEVDQPATTHMDLPMITEVDQPTITEVDLPVTTEVDLPMITEVDQPVTTTEIISSDQLQPISKKTNIRRYTVKRYLNTHQKIRVTDTVIKDPPVVNPKNTKFRHTIKRYLPVTMPRVIRTNETITMSQPVITSKNTPNIMQTIKRYVPPAAASKKVRFSEINKQTDEITIVPEITTRDATTAKKIVQTETSMRDAPIVLVNKTVAKVLYQENSPKTPVEASSKTHIAVRQKPAELDYKSVKLIKDNDIVKKYSSVPKLCLNKT